MDPAKKSPEHWLQNAEQEKQKGRFKIFLGYAPGVGKTFSMLSEGIRRRSRGEDVVIGYAETHGRVATADLAVKLEQVPRKELEYKGTVFEEMDVDAISARLPQVVLIDELAHTNVEGSRFQKRFEDVLYLLEQKVDVLSTINIQHIESLSSRVQGITGIKVREQVPDWVLDQADEVVLSDLTPEALITRMKRGDIYPMGRVEQSLANFFRRGNLIALREMALQRVTRAVDRSLEDYVRRKNLGSHWTMTERIAVCISSSPQAHDLIARGARLAEATNAELYILHVVQKDDEEPSRKQALRASLQFARNIGASICTLHGSDIARTTASFIRENRMTQAIVGRSSMRGLQSCLYYVAIQKFLAEAPNVDLHIVSQGSL